MSMYKHAAASDQAVCICILNPQLQTRLHIIYIGAQHQLHTCRGLHVHIVYLQAPTLSFRVGGKKKELSSSRMCIDKVYIRAIVATLWGSGPCYVTIIDYIWGAAQASPCMFIHIYKV